MWKRYFKCVKLKPDKVVTALFGEIDFSADNIGIDIIKTLYENGFPYLEITEEGKAELFRIAPEKEGTITMVKLKKGKKLEAPD